MTDLTALNLQPLHRADIYVTLALTNLMSLRPVMTEPGSPQLESTIAQLKRVLAVLREADSTLPPVEVYDPAESHT